MENRKSLFIIFFMAVTNLIFFLIAKMYKKGLVWFLPNEFLKCCNSFDVSIFFYFFLEQIFKRIVALLLIYNSLYNYKI